MNTHSMRNKILVFFLLLFASLILAVSVKGHWGNPSQQDLQTDYWRTDGPFELSPERGRFALTYSLMRNGTLFLSEPLARFSTPDLGFKNSQFISLFPPGVSYAVIPGYWLGWQVGLSQVATFAMISVFAVVNFWLVFHLSRKLGATFAASTLGALSFLFASPAFTYATTLYQHHVTVFLLLISLELILFYRKWWQLLIFWIFLGLSIIVDSPNFFLFFPLGVYGLLKSISVQNLQKEWKINVSFQQLATTIAVVFPMLLLLFYNAAALGNPFQLSGTMKAIRSLDEQVASASATVTQNGSTPAKKTAVGFFKTRNLIHGLTIHSFSPDRGVIWYTPVLLLGFIGFIHLYQKKPEEASLLLTLAGVNIVLYSLWGDPWGGWAFGSRYLIPTYAIFGVFLSQAFTWKNRLTSFAMYLIFWVTFIYSAGVNSLGALTSNVNPPAEESVALSAVTGKPEPYTYERNWKEMKSNFSKSFVYTTFLQQQLPLMTFWLIVWGAIVSVSTVFVIAGLINILTSEGKA